MHLIHRSQTGRFHLPDLTSLMDTMAYEMWKNTIGFFHLSGRTDELIMPITYQSIKGDVALDIVTHGPHMNLWELIALSLTITLGSCLMRTP